MLPYRYSIGRPLILKLRRPCPRGVALKFFGSTLLDKRSFTEQYIGGKGLGGSKKQLAVILSLYRVFIATTVILITTTVILYGGCSSSTFSKPPPKFKEQPCQTKPRDWGRPSHNQSVGLLKLPKKGICTGFLVAPSVVMTAAHCVNDESRPRLPGEAPILFSLPSGWTGVAEAWKSYSSDREGYDYTDVALIWLGGDAPAEPLELAPFPFPLSPVGRLTIVGYSSGRQREAWVSKAGWVHYKYRSDTGWICPGDSGGPVFEDGKVLAVAVSLWYVRHEGEMYYAAMGFSIPHIAREDISWIPPSFGR